ncbi:hypothetical protein JG687_00012032 [Phytophthora cactorum]|uniref:Uncharacterized protein n=1 Tax=Phytophthora cactorum TaxID=29920 RepID=A0A329S0X6_9STRA|nr:hypothetical protein PC113_g20431 [Phytophthora cactorum]KAG2906400.1 hypothetical protein PC117_g20528 [Phytophthora cactorum]KAG3136996.1 hypothetical protein C6341_g21171 [Phytophthora cactorum]KAG3221971.1 hypothetical protein PC129_g7310 [Phytophthora cactorum]KAG4044915.1 hypothetical protein PC123_g19668 [Phytophthora cactorum]
MDVKWAFLVPWREVFVECKAIYDVVDTSVSPVEIGDGGVKFIREEKPPRFGGTSADHIHSLELHFDEIEDEELLSDLYDVVGAGLRKLTMEMYWSEEYPRISFYGVALFCLNLEELS